MRWEQLCKQPWTTLREIQESRLRQFVTRQLPMSPYYRDLIGKHRIDLRKIRTLADLRYFPFTTKADLLPTPEQPLRAREFILQPNKELISRFWPLSKKLGLLFRKWTQGAAALERRLKEEYKPVLFTATTGRSAAQVMFFYSLHDLNNLRESGWRILSVVGQDPEGRVMNLFPYAPHLAFWQTYYAALSARCMAVSTGGGKVMSTTAHIGLIERFKPTLLAGVPSYLYHVLRTAAEQKRDFSSVACIVLGAEKVPVGLKLKMADLLGQMGAARDKLRILGTYGFTEAKMAWAEFPTPIDVSTGYFTYPDLGVFEVVNPDTGEPVGEGTDGELVYTSLDARGSVIVRYRTGDLVKGGMIWTQPCPYSGMTVPRINATIGRVSNQKGVQLTKVKGTLVNLDAMAAVLMGQPEVEEWAIEIRKVNDDPFGLDELVLYCALRMNFQPSDTIKQLLCDKLQEATEVTPNRIVFESVPELCARIGLESELKEKRFFDRRGELQPK